MTDPGVPTSVRVAGLLARLTLAEKVALLQRLQRLETSSGTQLRAARGGSKAGCRGHKGHGSRAEHRGGRHHCKGQRAGR